MKNSLTPGAARESFKQTKWGPFRSRNFDKMEGAEDIVSVQSSFIANAYNNEPCAFYALKNGLLKNSEQIGGGRSHCPHSL